MSPATPIAENWTMSNDDIEKLRALLDSGHPLPPMTTETGSAKRSLPPRRAPAKTATSASRAGGSGRFLPLNYFADELACQVGTSAQAVYLQLFREAKIGSNLASMSQQQIAHAIGRSVRTVGRAIKELVETGAIEIVKRAGQVSGMAIYRVCAPKERQKHPR